MKNLNLTLKKKKKKKQYRKSNYTQLLVKTLTLTQPDEFNVFTVGFQDIIMRNIITIPTCRFLISCVLCILQYYNAQHTAIPV